MEQKLEGKVAVITGAGRGLGRAYALRLARLGADIVVNDIDLHSHRQFSEQISADTVVEEVEALQRRAIGAECDVTNQANVDAMFERALSTFGHVDILVNNAGGLQVNPETSFASTVPEEDLRREVDRNLMSCIFCSQAAARSMKAQQYGKIVNVSSQAGLKGSANGFYSSYGMAKAAVINYTQCIAPAFIGTNRLMERSFNKNPGQLEALEKTIPIGRVGTEEDCARVVEFLVTDLSDYIVGQTIKICGGVLLF
jgi:NAD(P)-dependent dehydrogenase (short-subunit alcohol dehydrogenase family)